VNSFAVETVVLDMDSTEIPVYGQQEQSAYNGHFESTCYRPVLLFNRGGGCLAAKLRPGNVHSAEDWEELLLPEIERQQKLGKEVVFRADAAFAKPEIYEALEERGVKCAIRIPANDSLERDIAELSSVPVQRGQAVAERNRLQPREPVAATGAAAEGGEVVAGRLTATAGEDRRQAHQACTVLLATAAGTASETVTTATGNYTLASLPAGVYEMTVEIAGFRKVMRPNVQVQVAQTVRVDFALQIGTSTESVTVTAEAPLLRTENAEQSMNVTGDRINSLPINFGGGSTGPTGGIRNWMSFVILAPGVSGTAYNAPINGAPGGAFKIYLEGQDVTSSNDTTWEHR